VFLQRRVLYHPILFNIFINDIFDKCKRYDAITEKNIKKKKKNVGGDLFTNDKYFVDTFKIKILSYKIFFFKIKLMRKGVSIIKCPLESVNVTLGF